MNHVQKVQAIQHIRPDAEFVLDDLELKWLDKTQSEPTEAEIQAGWIAYQAKADSDNATAQAQKQAILNRLGITEEEAKLLLS